MGNKFSQSSPHTIKSVMYLDSEKSKKVKFKVDNIINHNQTAYVILKPQKKINYLKYSNVNFEIKDLNYKPYYSSIHDFEIFQNLIIEEEENNHKIFEAAFNLRQNLNQNQVSDTKYLEKHIVNIYNEYSIKVRINEQNNLLEEIIFIIPSSELQKFNM